MSGGAEDGLERIRAIAARLSNWGRWGAEDQRGTQNLVGDREILAASGSIVTGETFALGIPIDEEGPQPTWTRGYPRTNPIHLMTTTGNDGDWGPGARFADDAIFIGLQSTTQWDSLGHVHYDGKLYNGYPSTEITVQGLQKNSIFNMRRGIVGRGVLLDIPRLLGVQVLPVGHVIQASELDAAVEEEGITMSPGDVLLVRTGWLSAFQSGSIARDEFLAANPGLGLDCLDWLKAHDVSALAMDNFGAEVVPAEDPLLNFPFHMVAVRDMGLTIGELFALDELAAACATDNRWTFFFSGQPMPVRGGAGSPVNALAVR
jgi:kynurenine formamidase